MGNIYAQEALFKARIHPGLSADQLTWAQCQAVIIEIQSVLHHALMCGGTTLHDYRSALGETGLFQTQLQVYGRGGQPCMRCEYPLVLERMGGRSTVYCDHCAPLA